MEPSILARHRERSAVQEALLTPPRLSLQDRWFQLSEEADILFQGKNFPVFCQSLYELFTANLDSWSFPYFFPLFSFIFFSLK